jgi:crotonobetainyl-CoA:carnitine CoA-transferase CaiB-like acyl-CoA transferase
MHLSDWCENQSSDHIVARLWEAGVPVAKVMQPHRQTELPQLAFRRFFEDVAHPVNGVVPHSTLPMRFSLGPSRIHRRHAPLMGEHNREVLSELGLSDAEIGELEAQGVIGRAPAM